MSRTKTRGTGNGWHKLREAEVFCIRAYWKAGAQQKEIAALYQISRTQVWRIVHGINWGWLT